MEIYADPRTVNSRKVVAGMKFLGVPYELKHIDYLSGEHTSEAYIAINPNAALPSLKDGDLVLWESNAILQYAADKHEKSEFYPTDPGIRADINRWLFWESSAWFPSCYVYLLENCVKPLLGEAADQNVLEGEAERFNKLAEILDARLAQGAWVCGKSASIADISLAAPIHMHRWAGMPLEGYPNIQRWITENVEELDAWKATRIGEGFALLGSE